MRKKEEILKQHQDILRGDEGIVVLKSIQDALRLEVLIDVRDSLVEIEKRLTEIGGQVEDIGGEARMNMRIQEHNER